MKNSYPIILMPDKVGYVVYVPDFNINTEVDTLTEAIEMARDAIGGPALIWKTMGNPCRSQQQYQR